jgi:hypothetical protein
MDRKMDQKIDRKIDQTWADDAGAPITLSVIAARRLAGRIEKAE